MFTRNVSEVIIGADFDCTSRTFDLFDVVSEKDSLASFDREDLLWRDDRRWLGDAVISFEVFIYNTVASAHRNLVHAVAAQHVH